ncbi:MAG: hypothetical protein ACYC0H_05355, partial [Solirubrobacteraceae bacterium]
MVFLSVAVALGGPTEGDSAEVVYGTWAVAHGRLECVYPAVTQHMNFVLANPFALAAPAYPLLSGVLAYLLRLGHAVPFPSSATLGAGCSHGVTAMYHWSAASGVILPTVRLGYLSWAVLLAGVVCLVRASSRRGTGWEVIAGFLVAVAPPVVMCLTYFFHPQDLLAMGLALLATGSFVRGRLALSGVLIGCAVLAQQFAVLAAVALLILAGRRGGRRLLAGAAVGVIAIDAPFVAVSGWRAVKTAVLGSSRVGLVSGAHGGTVLFSTGLTGPLDFLVARVVPIVGAAVLAWWAVRATGEDARAPVSLVTAVVSGGLVLRLVFEVNLFGYYFMASVVGLVVLEVLRGQLGRD